MAEYTGALPITYRALFILTVYTENQYMAEYRALLVTHRALLIKYAALLIFVFYTQKSVYGRI